jgi:predicted Zn-dependent protease
VERAATRRLAGDAFSGLDAGGKGETKDAESQFVELAKDVTKSLMRLPERVDKDRISSHAEGALAEMDESKSGSERPTQAEKESELEAIAERAFPVVAGFRSRVEEFEADLLAVDFLAMAGYRTEAAEAVLGYLKSLEGDPASLADEATHPRFAERQEAVKAHIASRWSGNVRRMAHTKRRFKEFKHLID